MRDDLGYFGRLHAVVERQSKIVRQFDSLIPGDESRKGDHVAVWGERPGRLQRSPKTISSVYFVSAGATARTSSELDIRFAPWTVVCSAAGPIIRQNENTDAASSLIANFLSSMRDVRSATMRRLRQSVRSRRWQERRRSALRP